MPERILLTTTNRELFQPVRLHYTVANPKRLTACFQKLRCMAFDREQERWCWHFDAEARHLKFQPFPKMPEGGLTILGAFRIRPQGTADLSVRSIERAIEGILFFDKHVPRDVAQLTNLSVVNRLFSVEDAELTPEDIFDNTAAQRPSAFELATMPKDEMKKLSREEIGRYLENVRVESSRPFPEVELFPAHFYEDGISRLEMSLRLRQNLAYEHFQGNTQVTLTDLIYRGLGIRQSEPELGIRQSEPESSQGDSQRLEWSFREDIPTLDYFEDIDLDTDEGVSNAVGRFVDDLEGNTFRQWEAVMRVEQDLWLAPIYQTLYDELIDFTDGEDDQVLYIDDIERPAQPWYEILRRIAPRLLIEPLVTSEMYDEFVDQGWSRIAVALENNSRGLSLPAGIRRPRDVLPKDLWHKLWWQECCLPLLGLEQEAEITLRSDVQNWRIDTVLQNLNRHRDSVAFLGATLSSLLERCVLPPQDREIFIREVTRRLQLPGPDVRLAEYLDDDPDVPAQVTVERVSPDLIRRAILHPEQCVRYLAAMYFVAEHCHDPEIPRLMIQAVEQYGEEAFGSPTNELFAECVHSRESLAWLLARLQAIAEEEDGELEANDLTRALVEGDLEFLAENQSAVEAVFQKFDLAACDVLRFRLRHRTADLDTLWSSVREILDDPDEIRECAGEDFIMLKDLDRLANDPRVTTWLTETLERTIEDDGYDEGQEELAITLAGQLEFQPAIPQLVEYLHEDDDFCIDAINALIRIGGDDVVRALLRKAPGASDRFLANAVLVIEDIHTPLSAQTLLNWHEKKSKKQVAELSLKALLNGFVPAGLEPGRRLASAVSLDVCDSIRWRVVAMALATGWNTAAIEPWVESADYEFADEMIELDYDEADDQDEDEDEDTGIGERWSRNSRVSPSRSFMNDDGELLDDGDDFMNDDLMDRSIQWPSSAPIIQAHPKIGRNDPCPCGSGKKYKKCCMKD